VSYDIRSFYCAESVVSNKPSVKTLSIIYRREINKRLAACSRAPESQTVMTSLFALRDIACPEIKEIHLSYYYY